MNDESPTVFIIDPDESTRGAVGATASTMNLRHRGFASGYEFFGALTRSEPGCLVLEVKVADMSGLQIQRRLARLGATLPLIFLTSENDVSLAVELLRGGAVHYLQKPMRPLELMNALQEALALDRARRKSQQRRQRLMERLALLTLKQREVLRMIAEGKTTRTMAAALGVSPRTIELRRSSLIKKLGLKTPASLLRFALVAYRTQKRYLKGSHLPTSAPLLVPAALRDTAASQAGA